MKRLVFCFDGSWNRLDTPHPTNVVLTAETVLPVAGDGTTQVTFYDEGVGSEQGEGLAGGMFGAGLVKNLGDGYRFLIFNYAPGDEIYVFGFSRGAYTARSFVGLLNTCGILERRHARYADEAIRRYKRRSGQEAYRKSMLEFRRDHACQVVVSDEEDAWRAAEVPGYRRGDAQRLTIKYLAVWDTVGSLGIPRYLVMADAVNRQHEFHDVSLSPIVQFARHAVAIDEHRVDFSPTLWENIDHLNQARGAATGDADAPYQQMWFSGSHGSVGGGGVKRGLSDATLEWIWDGARHAGLDLDSGPNSPLLRMSATHRESLTNHGDSLPFSAIRFVLDRLPTADRTPGPLRLEEVSPSARRRWRERPESLPEQSAYRPATLRALAAELDAMSEPVDETMSGFSIHIVRPGETLRSIAERTYGSADAAGLILRANANKLISADGIHPGQALRLPEIAP